MKANNAGKVSNLTVGHHQLISSTLHHEQGAPLLASLARATGDTLDQHFKINTNDYEQTKKDDKEEHKETQHQELQDTPRNYGYVRNTQRRIGRVRRDGN